jgi:hypothetical protein
MAEVRLVFSEKFGDKKKKDGTLIDAALPKNYSYPVPLKLVVSAAHWVKIDLVSKGMFDRAVVDVPFTGVIHMKTGLIHMHPLAPDREGNAMYDGWVITHNKYDMDHFWGPRINVSGASYETDAPLSDPQHFQKSGHAQIGQWAQWDAIKSRYKGNDLKTRTQKGFGSDELFNIWEIYAGFSISNQPRPEAEAFRMAPPRGPFS